MKKEYEKPVAELVVFEMIDAIAANSCGANFFNHSRNGGCLPLIENVFDVSDKCSDEVPEEFCYNSNLEHTYFTS